MAYSIKHTNGTTLYESKTETTLHDALVEAVKGGADLGGANLRGAYLGGAYLGEQWIIQGPTRSDGYSFFLMRLKGNKTPMVRAGCRWLSLPDAHRHWESTRAGTQLGNESLDILVWLERAMNLRGLK